ncbi:MAG TPA: helix-turn-helix domain-containing protein [Holophaga sp.]|nr:helix-turn-helix domain-containing protein [Holophaga sp.]
MQCPADSKWTHWRSQDHAASRQFSAWQAALDESYLPWSLQKPASSRFRAEIDMRDIGGVRLLHCISDPCRGQRTQHEINQGKDAYYGLLLLYEGTETVTCQGNDVHLEPCRGILWDSTRPISFQFSERLKKVTLLVPQTFLKARFQEADRFVCEPMDMSSGLGAVAASYMIALAREATSLEDRRGRSLVDMSLELIATCLEAKAPRPITKARSGLLERVKEYVDRNLDDPGLGPGAIAEAFGISNRYLHLLFEDEGTTVANSILVKRLEQCRRDLLHNEYARMNITEIAFKWGFNDSAHFCHAFKKLFGASPREYQKLYMS